jgi:hypothetical protein
VTLVNIVVEGEYYTKHGKEIMSNKLISRIQEIIVTQNKNNIISLPRVNSKQDLSCQIPENKNISNVTPSSIKYPHNGVFENKEEAKTSKKCDVNNPSLETVQWTKRKRRPLVRNQDFLWE